MPKQPLSKAHRMSYRIARGEQGVLTFEPYKSEILPLWRFRTPTVARKSSKEIYARFLAYNAADDFIGMDMARKFLQMGMTRAKRYANHKGGRKYDKDSGVELERSTGHEGMEEKLEASLIFKEVWERAKGHAGYQAKKERFLEEQKEWDKEHERGTVEDGTGRKVGEHVRKGKEVKKEEDGEPEARKEEKQGQQVIKKEEND